MIPKIIHQTWKTQEVPEHWKESQEEWQKLMDYGWEYMLWTDEDNRNLIKTYYPWFLNKFDSYEHNIQRADAVRYFILHKYGGVYSDLDIVPIIDKFLPMFDMYKNYEIVVTETNRDNQVAGQLLTNFFMMSKQGSEFWHHVWELLQDPAKVHKWKAFLINFSYYFEVLLTTGPGVVNDATLTYERPKDIVVLPAGLISSYSNQDNAWFDTSSPAVMKHIRGESWHQGDVYMWNTLKPLLRWKNLILVVVCIVAIIVGIIFWKKYTNCRNKNN